MQTATHTAEAPTNYEGEREAILAALSAFIRQRPGLEFANYGDVSAYRSELRSITKDRHHAEELLAAVSWRSGIDAAALREAFRAFSGRLSWDGRRLDYCTGQYFPTEYRRAVCAVLSSALWDCWRDNAPADTASKGDYIRKTARRELSRAVAGRWFN